MKCRNEKIDYLKCGYIVLMVAFHLAYIGDKYPYIKQVVYTFHMPAFLILSGFLANMRKEWHYFAKSLAWKFIPFAVMETGYVFMSSVLPVREKIEDVNLSVFLYKVFISPMGPYWYLHTWILCYFVYYIVSKTYPRTNGLSVLILLGLLLWLLSCIGLISMANAVYFIIGVGVQKCKVGFTSIFQASAWAIILLCVLCCYPGNLDRYSLPGITITYLSISALLTVYPYLHGRMKLWTLFIGRNTFPVLLFSPIFTILSKYYLPLFSFDPTGLTFAFTATAFTIYGCLFMAGVMDKLKLSPFFCGKRELLSE